MEPSSRRNQQLLSSLRHRAEHAVDKRGGETDDLSVEDVMSLLHELQVHKVELEMQNDELQLSEKRYQTLCQRFVDLYNLAPFGYLAIENPDHIKEANIMAADMLGVHRSGLIGRRFTDFLPPEEQDNHFIHIRFLLRNHIPQQYILNLKSIRDEDLYVRIDAYPGENIAGDVVSYCITMTDITELKQTETTLQQALGELENTQSQLIQQERLAAVGQLAAGVAHDFNNILTVVSSNAELLLFSWGRLAGAEKHVQAIIQTSERATQLVKQILDFSQKSIQCREQIDLVQALEKLIQFLGHTIPENIQISLSIKPAQYWIEADPTQLHQVFMNLAINARDAMSEGGSLAINLSHLSTMDYEIPLIENQYLTGNWICVEVSDTGYGIPAEHLAQIFEPFFTTKQVGQGVGLGLSQVYGIIKQHGWHVAVKSEVDRGTTFSVYMPMLREKTAEKAPTASSNSISRGRGESILLVEDDPDVLTAIMDVLESLNYQVVTAANGQLALKVYQEHNGEIDLVLSDMVMPDMEGEALFYALKRYHPDLKMILMSGYPLGIAGAKLVEQGLVAWVQKPIPLQKLSQIVGDALAAV